MDPVTVVILVPFAGAVGTLFARRRAPVVTLAAALAGLVATVWLLAAVWEGGAVTVALGGWPPPLGIELRADGPATAMVVVTALVVGGATVYAGAVSSLAENPPSASVWGGARAFWPLWLLLWGALNASFLTRDLFNFYVSLELLTVSAVALVVLGEDRSALTAAMRYLLAAFLASLLYLLGVAMLYGAHGALDIDILSAAAAGAGPEGTWPALGLVTVGLLLKSALFPLHFWLPKAHASAPPPVSGVLSALVVKASFVMLLRIWLEVFPQEVTLPPAQLVAALGAAAIAWGSVQAIRSQRLKLLVAHSTVAQMGYLAVILPLVVAAPATPGVASPSSVEAWQGGFYHIATHALAKASMFLVAGVLVTSYGTDRLRDLTGAAGRHPLSFFAFGLAGVALIGIPPSGGFVAKWLLVGAAIGHGQWWWAAVILAGGLLTAGYVFHALGQAMTSPADPEERHRAGRDVARRMELAALGLAAASVALGFRAAEPLALLVESFPGG